MLGLRKVARIVLRGLVVVILVLALDLASGLVYMTDTRASVVTVAARSGTAGELLLVFPGYAADCRSISRAFSMHLNTDQQMVVLCYAERGIDDNQVYELMSSHVQRLKRARVQVLAGSMGGMVAARFLSRLAKESQYQPPFAVELFLDTAPASKYNVKRPSWIFSLSKWYRGGVISSSFWAVASWLSPKPSPEAGADVKAIADGDRQNEWIGAPALTTQAEYLASFDTREVAAVMPLVSEARFLIAESSDRDPLVRVGDTIARWQTVLPKLRVLVVLGRQGNWHLPWTYRPGETMRLVNAPDL